MRIGIAEYAEGPTGCSVFHFPEGADCEIDVRGGSPGLFGGNFPRIDALFLTGGSLYGVEVGCGVAGEIFEDRQAAGPFDIAMVNGAVIFDYLRRDTLVHPDKKLGAAAYRAARPGHFAVGARGAGCRASVGQLWGSKRFAPEPGGQGCAVRKVGDATIAVFTVLNPLGGICGEDGRPLRGFLDTETGERRTLQHIIENHPQEVGLMEGGLGKNTTITAVIVDRHIPQAELRQFGRQIHTSMAQVIRPFHTPFDGDMLFSVSAGKEPLGFSSGVAAEIASGLAREAIYSAVLG